jgi:branched-chain amino acid transport system ATP-binding protein
VGLERRANDIAGSLAYGEQRRLEIARALGTQPGVLLLDEPAAGTNPAEKRELATLIRQINEDGIGVLLIEHDMKLVMSVADRIVVLNFGRRIAEGTPAEIQRDPAVVAAYLGTSAEEAAVELDSHSQPELHVIDTSADLGSVGTAADDDSGDPAGSAQP